MPCKFHRESAQGLWEEILPLLHLHKDEVAHYEDIPLDPDVPFYNQSEMQGKLRCYTARIDGVLVGYAIYFVHVNPHYQGSVQAYQDVLFVLKEHRHGRVGLGLIRYSERDLEQENIQVMYQHVKATALIRQALKQLLDRSDVGKLMELLGYELIDLIYGKRLDR